MILASFTSIYIPTLATVSTIVALATVYIARADRREERLDAFLKDWTAGFERVESAVLDLLELAEPAKLGNQLRRFDVARRRLRSAVASSAMPSFVRSADALATEPPEQVIANVDQVLADVARAIDRAEVAVGFHRQQHFGVRRIVNPLVFRAARRFPRFGDRFDRWRSARVSRKRERFERYRREREEMIRLGELLEDAGEER